MSYEVAVYYFPQYHRDPLNDRWHGAGWTEWELVRAARPRFPGHQQPKVPLWGYEDEADPAVAARKIDAAADHAIDTFIYDWYWYNGAPFLNGALDTGFLGAPNHDRLKFALMWANHDWVSIFPRAHAAIPQVMAAGAASRHQFEAAVEHITERYFAHPSYWRIDGRPYFSIYELMTLMRGLNGLDGTRRALDWLRERVHRVLGCDLHLNAIVWGIRILPTETELTDPRTLVHALGFDSVTSYVWMHHVPFDSFPAVSYPDYAERAARDWERLATAYGLPYYPNVSMGWDSSPRTVQSDPFDLTPGYPYTSVLIDNTPTAFEQALIRARDFLRRHSTQRILTINNWNEWTEGSYLEPDTIHGMAYLEALERVFGV
ncbi:MAG TPA: glycoside hydrolase family 99-like domain-containing protein [Chloroflexota bacterium]|nr:glycoside hydrolase family 99-like domain-containing protein [Chloroflexota bacterium]